MPAAAVVIPNWNSLEYLKRCLESVAEQSVDVELMVVDNGSADESVSWLKSGGVPHISLPENRGFAEAVNRGVAATESPLIFVLNADAVLEPDCLARLVSVLRGDAELGGVQPLILQEEAVSGARKSRERRIYSAGQALTPDGRAYEISQGEPLASTETERREVFGVCGAACLLKRELFDELQGYDESYFAFYEDVDLNVRGRIHGWTFAIEPAALARHIGNAVWQTEFKRPASANARLVARNRLATQTKYVPLRLLPRIVFVEAGSLLRALKQRRLRPTLRGKIEALRWMPRLLKERERLRHAGSLSAARRWLGNAR